MSEKTAERTAGSGARLSVVFSLVLGASLILLFSSVLGDWARFVYSDPTYSYGMLVPLVVAYLVYAIAKQSGWARVRAELGSSPAGYALVAAGCVLLAFGEASTIAFLTRAAFLVVLAGFVLVAFGKRTVRRFIFPLGFMLFLLPLPALIYLPLSARLQQISSALAGGTLDALNVPALREGNIIVLPHAALEVVQACSGIHSLFALGAVTVLAGYLLLRNNLKRGLLALMAIPLAVLLNGLRISVIALVTYNFGEKAAEGAAHMTAGSVIFAIGCVLMLILCSWLGTKRPRVRRDEQRGEPPPPRGRRLAPWGYNVAAAVLVLGFAAALHFGVRPDRPAPLRQPLASFPLHFDGWSGHDLPVSRAQLESLAASAVLLREYSNPKQSVPVSLYVAYYNRQQEGSSMHSPMHCIPGAGWQVRQSATLPIILHAQPQILANKLVFAYEQDRMLVIYWYEEQGEPERNELQGALSTFFHAISEQRSDGCLIRISAPIVGSEAQTLRDEMAFIERAVPLLVHRFLPGPGPDIRVAGSRAGSLAANGEGL